MKEFLVLLELGQTDRETDNKVANDYRIYKLGTVSMVNKAAKGVMDMRRV